MKIRKLTSATLAILAGFALSGTANAAVVSCYGSLYGAYTTKDGAVIINGSWRGNWTQICNLNTEWKGVPTQTCWGWFAQVNAAVAESKKIRITHSAAASATCGALLTYGSSAAPDYVMLIDQ